MQIVPLLVIRRLASVTTTQEQQCRSAPSLPSSYACPHCSDWQAQVSRRIPRSAMPVSTRAPRPTWNAAGTAITPPAMVVVTQKAIAAPIDAARSMTELAARDQCEQDLTSAKGERRRRLEMAAGGEALV